MANGLTIITSSTCNQLTKRENINENWNYNMGKTIKLTNTKICIFTWANVNQFQEVKEIWYAERYNTSRNFPPAYKSYALGAVQESIFSPFSYLMTEKAPGLLPCRERKRIPFHGPRRHQAESRWPWNEKSVLHATVSSTITWTWWDLGMRKKEILTTVPYANIRKDSYHGDPRYIETEDPALNAK